LILLESACPETSSVNYDRFSGTLVFAFTRDQVPSVGVALSDFLLLRVDPSTEEIVGVEVEHFDKAAVYQHPKLFGAVQWVDIPAREIDHMRKRLDIPNNRAPETNLAALKRGLMHVMARGLAFLDRTRKHLAPPIDERRGLYG